MRTDLRSFLLSAVMAASVAVGIGRAEDWPQWMGANRDDVWHETGTIDRFPAAGPKIVWRVAIEGGYAGPAVVGNRVFVTDYSATGDKSPDPGKRNDLTGKERVLCLDAAAGTVVWKFEYPCKYKVSYPAGPRCTPTVDEGKVYTLGSMGNLYCLNADTGAVIWSKDFVKDYHAEVPVWGFCSHPLVDGQKLVCVAGGPGAVAVAFDKTTGKELWRALSAREPGYCPPTIITAGGARQLIIWHAESINSLDPETGAVYWSVPLEPNYGMAIMAPRRDGEFLFAGAIVNKAVLLKLAKDKPAAEVVWRGKKDPEHYLYPVNSTPFVENGYAYGVDQPGPLRCVKLSTGERLWDTTRPTTGGKGANAGTAFLTKNGDKFFLMSETGDLIIARLTPKGYEELSRAKILEPTGDAFGRHVVWSHPAFASKCAFARNDKELVCVSLAE